MLRTGGKGCQEDGYKPWVLANPCYALIMRQTAVSAVELVPLKIVKQLRLVTTFGNLPGDCQLMNKS
jgi:hypothetical protein